MKPTDMVALILAFIIVMFFAAGFYKLVAYGADPNSQLPKLWADLATVIVGGLIGYMAGKNH